MKTKLLNNFRFRAMLLVAMLCAAFTGAWANEESVTFSEQDYENGTVITSYDGSAFSIAFAQGSNTSSNSVPKYYAAGTAIRCYAGNTFTVTSNYTITNIELTFGSGDGTNEITTDVGAYSNNVWTGSSKEVVFTIGGTSKHRRIASLTVTYSISTSKVAKPTFTPSSGSYSEAQNVTISCGTSGATIYYTLDGSTPTNNSNVYSTAISINKTTTVKAIGIKSGMSNSDVATATYTINIPKPKDAVDIHISKTTGGWTTSASATYASEYATIKYSAEEVTTGGVRIQHWNRNGGHNNNMYSYDDTNLGFGSAVGSSTSEDYRIYPSKGYYVAAISLDFIPGKHPSYAMNGVRVWANGDEDSAVTSPDASTSGHYEAEFYDPEAEYIPLTIGQLAEGGNPVFALTSNFTVTLRKKDLLDPFVDDDPNAEVGDVALNVPIVDGVRQKPTIETSGFAINTVGYLYNVGTGKFFTESSNGTQACIGENGILVKITESSSAYLLNSYSLNSTFGAGWYHSYFASEEALNVDGKNPVHRRFSIVNNNNGTFRLTSWESDSEYDLYSGSYFVGLRKSNSSNTALSPFLLPDEGDVDWALVTRAQYKSYVLSMALYDKAQELKGLIDQIEELNADASSVKSVYLNADATNGDIEEAITSAQALYQQAVLNKPEYVQPLLEEAMAEMQAYTTSLMGKTEFAALTQALADAQAAIDSQNGMPEALENLNNIKESVIASVNQFTTEGVGTSLTSLKDLISTAPITQLIVAPTDVTGTYNVISYAAEKGQSGNEPVLRDDGELRIYANGIFSVISGGDNMTSIVFNLSKQGVNRLAAITASTGSITQQSVGDQTVTWTGNAASVTFTVSDRAEYGSSSTQAGQFDLTGFTVSFLADGETKYNATTKASINALITSIEGNTGYETSEINQLKADISAAANSYNTSVAAYQNLKTAIGGLQSIVSDNKASQVVLDATQTLLDQAVAGYNACSLTDQEANNLVTNLNSQKTTLQSSITKYTNLAAAIENLKTELDNNNKVATDIRNNAQTLYDSDYQGYQDGSFTDEQIAGEIEQLNSARYSLISSATYYSSVADAISELETSVTKKAMNSLISEATILLAEKSAEYEQGTLEYDESLISNMQALKANIDASATEYAKLAIAIEKLEEAIAEVSGETAHVSQSAVSRANLRLTQTTNQYNDGSIADEDIPTRITTIDNLCESLTYSVHLYNQFNESLIALKEELDKNAKVAATVRTDAQTLYDDDSAAYEDGSIDDDNIEEEVGKLQTAITNLQNSALLYEQLAEAIPALQTAVTKKAMQSIMDEATNLLNQTQGDYEVGTINDDDIAQRISDMIDIENRIDESAEQYSNLAIAIAKLEEAIAEVSGETAHVSQSAVSRANLRLTQTTNQYNAGSIADEDIPTRITTIDNLCESLTYSLHLYNQFNESLIALKEELDKNAKVAATVRTDAQTLYDDDSAAYEDGSIDDDNIEEEVGKLQTAITNLQNSALLYEQLAEAIPALQTAVTKKAMQSIMDEATNLLNQTQGDYEVGTINDEDIAERISDMIDIENRIDESAEQYSNLAIAITKLEEAINEVSGETAHVSQSAVSRANLRLTQTTNQYNAGSIADEDIPTRITTIDNLCESLTYSLHLYNQFNESLIALKEELEKNAKVAATVRTDAEATYNTDLTAYNDGSIDDDKIEAECSNIQAVINSLSSSAVLYSQLNGAIDPLKTELDKNNKVAAEVRTNAETVYSAAKSAYDEASIADADIPTEVSTLNAEVTNLQNSAAAYETLQNAIVNIETELNKDAKVYAELRSAAESAYNEADNAYGQASIADEEIPTMVAALNGHVTALQNSAAAYEVLNDAIASLEAAAESAEGKVAEALLANGSTLLSAAQTAYEQGTIEDADIEVKNVELLNAAANLNAADGLNAKALARTAELTELTNALTEAESLLAQAKTDVATCYIESEKKNAIEARLEEYTNSLSQLNSDNDAMNDRLAADQQTQSDAINSITTAYAPALGASVTDLTNMEQEIADALAEVNSMTEYLNEEPVASITASSNIVELTAEFGTFCSNLNLDFTNVEGLKAYIVAAYIPAEGKVILTRVYNVPAGTGLIVRGTPDGRYEIPAGDGMTVLSNLLVGITRSKDLPVESDGKTNCILAEGTYGIGFYPTSGGILPAGKAYLPLPTSVFNTTNGVKGFTLVFEDATGIDEVKVTGKEDIWYTIDGQMLQKKPTVPGIYVRNGKKVLIKN